MLKEDLKTARRRKASLLLSRLLLTPDAGLEAFRERRAGASHDALHLRRARDVTEAIASAILDGHLDGERLERAWEILCRDATELAGHRPSAVPPAHGVTTSAPHASARAPSAPAPSPLPPAPVGPPSAPPPPMVVHPPPPPPPSPMPGPPPPTRVGAPLPIPQGPPTAAPMPVPPVTPRAVQGSAPPPAPAPPSPQGPPKPAPVESIATPPPSSKAAKARARLSQTAPPRSNRGAKALPFRSPAEQAVANRVREPALTLEQYASFHVELEASRDRPARDAVLRRYGVAEGQLAALDEAWQKRFRELPELHVRYRRAHDEYLAWLVRSKPRGGG